MMALATYGLALVIRSRNIKLTELPASARVIILSGYGASITTSAMHVAVSKHIEVFIASPRYGIMAMFVPSPLINASRGALAIRRKQFEAVINPMKTAAIARAIVYAKIKAENHSKPLERAVLSTLNAARTTDDIRHIEAKAAQVWWRQWTDFELAFKGRAVSTEWRSFSGRYIGRAQGRLGELAAQFTPRNAVYPMQALQNYAVGIAAARATRAVIARGLDAGFGFLHDGRKPGRLSLVWDAVEPLRPEIVRTVFGYASKRTFKKTDFTVIAGGIVRLTGDVARELAGVVIGKFPITKYMDALEIIERKL